jgi:hypothetical protein
VSEIGAHAIEIFLRRHIQQRVCIAQRLFLIPILRAADSKIRRDDTFQTSDFCDARNRVSSSKKHFGARRNFRYVAAALRVHLKFRRAAVDSPEPWAS